jgi:hypothetical protein
MEFEEARKKLVEGVSLKLGGLVINVFVPSANPMIKLGEQVKVKTTGSVGRYFPDEKEVETFIAKIREVQEILKAIEPIEIEGE